MKKRKLVIPKMCYEDVCVCACVRVRVTMPWMAINIIGVTIKDNQNRHLKNLMLWSLVKR